VSGETRTCVIIVGDGGSTTVINEPGVRIGDAEWQRFAEAVAGSAAGCAAACISGSLPPGCPEGGLAKLIAAASDERRRPVWVDSSGRALAEAVTAAPHGIKINADEAAALFGRPVASPQQALTAAREIRGRGPERVAVTLGAEGAVIATEGGSWHAEPPRIDPVNTVGSGDCFLAGLIAGFAADGTAATALRLATACGAANALSREAGHFPADELRLMLAGTRVLQLAD
jgi:1-phosphofructokinase family hexose kinase